ncbi:MAG: hypothetical protein GY729_13830 [Desulfobacteraceae bacterium]|nr:hypothetical protein [Desulfobacteraceae bacterium]
MDFGPFGSLNKVAEALIKKSLPDYHLNIPGNLRDEAVKNFRKELKKDEFEQLEQLQGEIKSQTEDTDEFNRILDQQKHIVKTVLTRLGKKFPNYDWESWIA